MDVSQTKSNPTIGMSGRPDAQGPIARARGRVYRPVSTRGGALSGSHPSDPQSTVARTPGPPQSTSAPPPISPGNSPAAPPAELTPPPPPPRSKPPRPNHPTPSSGPPPKGGSTRNSPPHPPPVQGPGADPTGRLRQGRSKGMLHVVLLQLPLHGLAMKAEHAGRRALVAVARFQRRGEQRLFDGRQLVAHGELQEPSRQ